MRNGGNWINLGTPPVSPCSTPPPSEDLVPALGPPILPIPSVLEPYAPPLLRLLGGTTMPPSPPVVTAVIRMYDAIDDYHAMAVMLFWLTDFIPRIPTRSLHLGIDHFRRLAQEEQAPLEE